MLCRWPIPGNVSGVIWFQEAVQQPMDHCYILTSASIHIFSCVISAESDPEHKNRENITFQEDKERNIKPIGPQSNWLSGLTWAQLLQFLWMFFFIFKKENSSCRLTQTAALPVIQIFLSDFFLYTILVEKSERISPLFSCYPYKN